MHRFRKIIPLALAILLIASFSAAKDEPATPNEEAIEFAKGFKKTYKKLPEGEVLEGIDRLVAFYKNKEVDGKKARKAIIDTMGKVCTMRDSVVLAHAMKRCGDMGEDVAKVVLMTLARELKKKVPEDRVYGAALDTLGKLHSEDPKIVKTMTDLLKNKDDAIVARACYAMVGYKAASGRTRKVMFVEIIKQSEGVYSSAQAQNDNMKRKWTIIEDDVMDALNSLSIPPRAEGAKFDNPPQARSWYNDNKKAPWDARD